MARVLVAVTQAEVDKQKAAGIRSREFELIAYDFELDHHNSVIDTLGKIAWDKNTEKYKDLPSNVMVEKAIADGLDSAAIAAISDLIALDIHTKERENVLIQRAKSERSYESLLTALPDGPDRATAINAVWSDEATAKAK